MRGRFDSEGEWYPFALEGPDGFDTIALAHEPALVQRQKSARSASRTAAATRRRWRRSIRPALAAQFVSEGMSNYHTSAMRQGGAMELRFMIYAFQMAITSHEAAANRPLRLLLERERANIREWLRRTPLRAGVSPLRHLPSYERWVLDVLTHGDYDDYWKQHGYNVEEYYDRAQGRPGLSPHRLVRLLLRGRSRITMWRCDGAGAGRFG